MKPATVTLREILVSVPVQGTGTQATFNAAIQDAAKTKIDAVRARAVAGEDFLKLIAEVSESGTKANNGLIGPVVVDELNPLLAAALEKMQPGDISEVLRSRAGYQIFKLEIAIGCRTRAVRKGAQRDRAEDLRVAAATVKWRNTSPNCARRP